MKDEKQYKNCQHGRQSYGIWRCVFGRVCGGRYCCYKPRKKNLGDNTMTEKETQVWDELYEAARVIVRDFDEYGEVLQTNDEYNYGPNSAIEELRETIRQVERLYETD